LSRALRENGAEARSPTSHLTCRHHIIGIDDDDWVTMQIAVNGKQFQIGDSLRGHIDQSIRQISEKYFSNPIDATVTMSREGGNVRADISVHVGRRILIQGQSQNADAYASFDGAAAKIDKRLRRFKRRLRDHDHHAPALESVEAQEIVFAAETEDDGAAVTPEDSEWRPVELSEAPILMFRNAAHGEINVVFRRSDGNIGWIDPKSTS
jgi:ribosomal subunit interface protein